jgi:hypothetical protein
MTVFDFGGGVASGIALIIAGRVMICGRRSMDSWMRISVGVVAAALVLTFVERMTPGSPFADWAFLLLRFGIVVLFFRLAAVYVKHGQPGGDSAG